MKHRQLKLIFVVRQKYVQILFLFLWSSGDSRDFLDVFWAIGVLKHGSFLHPDLLMSSPKVNSGSTLFMSTSDKLDVGLENLKKVRTM